MTPKQLLYSFLISPGGLIIGATLSAISLRIFFFPFTWKDLWIGLCIILSWPVLEYLAHRYLMHEWGVVDSKFLRKLESILGIPFRFTHDRHHNSPTPETGLPDRWVIYMLSLIHI